MSPSSIKRPAALSEPLWAWVREVLAQRMDEPGALLPILHELQERLGCIPPEVVPEIASALNLSRAEVHGVISYYSDFRESPAVGQVVQICLAEACQARGANALLKHAEQRLGCALHEASSDGQFTLEPRYCLGLCALSPAIALGDEVHARVTPQRLDELLAQARSQP